MLRFTRSVSNLYKLNLNLNLKIGNMQMYTNAKTMNYELKRLELATMNVFMYLLVLIIGKSKVLFVLRD